jgi:glycosyltransferase involved in cell wall biosynthesis
VREFFRHGTDVWLVEPEAKALAAAIRRLGADEGLRQQLGRAGHDAVAARFSSTGVAAELERALRLAIAVRSGRPLQHHR